MHILLTVKLGTAAQHREEGQSHLDWSCMSQLWEPLLVALWSLADWWNSPVFTGLVVYKKERWHTCTGHSAVSAVCRGLPGLADVSGVGAVMLVSVPHGNRGGPAQSRCLGLDVHSDIGCFKFLCRILFCIGKHKKLYFVSIYIDYWIFRCI